MLVCEKSVYNEWVKVHFLITSYSLFKKPIYDAYILYDTFCALPINDELNCIVVVASNLKTYLLKFVIIYNCITCHWNVYLSVFIVCVV